MDSSPPGARERWPDGARRWGSPGPARVSPGRHQICSVPLHRSLTAKKPSRGRTPGRRRTQRGCSSRRNGLPHGDPVQEPSFACAMAQQIQMSCAQAQGTGAAVPREGLRRVTSRWNSGRLYFSDRFRGQVRHRIGTCRRPGLTGLSAPPKSLDECDLFSIQVGGKGSYIPIRITIKVVVARCSRQVKKAKSIDFSHVLGVLKSNTV
jgi:hypothetical protein